MTSLKFLLRSVPMDVVHATFSPSVSTTLSRVIIYRPPTVSPYVRYFTEHHEDGAVFSIRSVIGVDNPTQLRKDDLILIKLKSNFIFTAHFITQCDSQKENGGWTWLSWGSWRWT